MVNEEHMTKAHKPTRRWFLAGAAAAVAGGGVFASNWFNIFADVSGDGALSVADAYHQADAGEIYLIDIRRPDEWEKTGIAVPAIPLDMRRDDFETVLQAIFAQSGDKPVALICARGVRSARTDTRLRNSGFANIIDVPEGMLGSGAGPGYIKSGLPLRAPSPKELDGKVLTA